MRFDVTKFCQIVSNRSHQSQNVNQQSFHFFKQKTMNYFDCVVDDIFFVISNHELYLTVLIFVIVVFCRDENVTFYDSIRVLITHVEKFRITRILILNSLNQRDQ